MSATAPLLLGDEDLAEPAKRKRRTRKAAPAASEAQIQRAIIDAMRWRGVLAVHVPNAGKRSAVAGRRLKGEGMRPGFPDLLLYAHGVHALIEVKRPGYRPSDVSDAQREMHATLTEHGARVTVVDSVDAALAFARAAGMVR